MRVVNGTVAKFDVPVKNSQLELHASVIGNSVIWKFWRPKSGKRPPFEGLETDNQWVVTRSPEGVIRVEAIVWVDENGGFAMEMSDLHPSTCVRIANEVGRALLSW